MIHDLITRKAVDMLVLALMDELPSDDIARAGAVVTGPLQGNPDPDQARISVTVHENDPDTFYGTKSSMSSAWTDEVLELECGGSITWKRRFTVKARCLLVNTAEDKDLARRIASSVRSRIERTLLKSTWNDIVDEESGEYVSMGILNNGLSGEMVQAGGPPDAYDYHIKIRFELYTTVGVIT